MIENELTVYSKPSCVQCNATYRALLVKAGHAAAAAGGTLEMAGDGLRIGISAPR